jgi:menaquinone-dependent protoporphyrinogen oxidase
MPTVLIAYATTHGHTGRIATRLRDVLREAGLDAQLGTLGPHADVSPDGADAVLVGASIHVGRHQPEIVDWLREHRAALSGLPTALFSVSMTAADPGPEAQATARGYVDELLGATGWVPDATAFFGGALQYREYGRLTRLLMRMMARRHDQPTDVSHDHDYTDWAAVERFGRDFAAQVTAAAAPAR